ncbi:hypothetical protein VTK73DRAFT_5395 [Phialemonium thermophilum]|uniref:Artemis protein n=1 Tax=Phialemonium thermophilum TaxID=223376 RepID=A0ABR3XY20_9PEZI
MSTFNGLLEEFPDIRVDFFRRIVDRRPPLACFLSHVHSDHLAGLESLRSPFVFCSAATRALLLRLERYPCRINYAKGILEARVQTYRHLKNILKPIPLETPTVLELEPGNSIRVTLFNANHCPGAVMFLFEGRDKAALYTGDVRSEPWFVNALTRSPSLVEYAYGLKTLDTIYLDTSFTEDVPFQTKAEGIRELLQKVAQYPSDTIFHFQAWTYGYEDVWIALSKALESKIHVDKYKVRVYKSLVADPAITKAGGACFPLATEAPALVGFVCGNAEHPGCLTTDINVRLHSCEKGNYCDTVRNSSVVWIQPIVAHLPGGGDVEEMGVGGGGDDLEREAELDLPTSDETQRLLELISDENAFPDQLKENIRSFLLAAVTNGRNIPLDLDVTDSGDDRKLMISNVVQALAQKSLTGIKRPSMEDPTGKGEALSNLITFPYSRHSSYPELCHLIEAFKPKDIWPCTVDPVDWSRNHKSIHTLFGRHCSGNQFRHDTIMESIAGVRNSAPRDVDTQMTASSEADTPVVGYPPSRSSLVPYLRQVSVDPDVGCSCPGKPALEDAGHLSSCQAAHRNVYDALSNSQCSSTSQTALDTRYSAFQTMLENLNGRDWRSIGIVSATDNHTMPEDELGLQ